MPRGKDGGVRGEKEIKFISDLQLDRLHRGTVPELYWAAEDGRDWDHWLNHLDGRCHAAFSFVGGKPGVVAAPERR